MNPASLPDDLSELTGPNVIKGLVPLSDDNTVLTHVSIRFRTMEADEGDPFTQLEVSYDDGVTWEGAQLPVPMVDMVVARPAWLTSIDGTHMMHGGGALVTCRDHVGSIEMTGMVDPAHVPVAMSPVVVQAFTRRTMNEDLAVRGTNGQGVHQFPEDDDHSGCDHG